MCGLFGINLNKPDSRVVPLIAAMAVLMDCRGGHSWGYYADGEVHRGLGTFTSGNQARNFGGLTKVMCHTRLASVGAKTIENAHPFEIGHIIGAHNGHIGNYWDLNKEYERKYDVDSQHIFAHIDSYGFDRLNELNGYGAITWLDNRDPETFNFTRWNGGDLAICDVFTKDGRELGTVWASTLNALGASLEMAGFKFKNYRIDEKKLYYTKGFHLFVDKKDLDFGSKSWQNQNYKGLPGKKKEEKAPSRPPVGMSGPNGYWAGGKFHQWDETQKEKGPKELYVSKLSDESKVKLRRVGYDIEQVSSGTFVLRRKEPLRRPEENLDFGDNVITQRRKCFGCDTPNVNTVRHEEMNCPLCFYCTMQIDGAMEIEEIEVDEITQQFEMKMRQEDEEEGIPAAFKNFLETGGTGDTITIPDADEATIYGRE